MPRILVDAGSIRALRLHNLVSLLLQPSLLLLIVLLVVFVDCLRITDCLLLGLQVLKSLLLLLLQLTQLLFIVPFLLHESVLDLVVASKTAVRLEGLHLLSLLNQLAASLPVQLGVPSLEPVLLVLEELPEVSSP